MREQEEEEEEEEWGESPRINHHLWREKKRGNPIAPASSYLYLFAHLAHFLTIIMTGDVNPSYTRQSDPLTPLWHFCFLLNLPWEKITITRGGSNGGGG